MPKPYPVDKEKSRQNMRYQRQKEKNLLANIGSVFEKPPATVEDYITEDVLKETPPRSGPQQRAKFKKSRSPSGKVDSKLAKRILKMYLQEMPLGLIVSKTGALVEIVQEVLQIQNVPCVRCGVFRLGNTTMYEGELPLCRACRRSLRI